MLRLRFSLLLSLLCCSLVPGIALASELENDIPAYEPVSGIFGTLTSVGSDTLANLVIFWSEEFSRFYPNVNIQIQAAGSSTAAPALTQGTANIVPVSRELKDSEIEAFEIRFSYKPTAVPVAIDALAVFVHQDNPLEGLNLQQLDAIFSITRYCGYTHRINDWSELGLSHAWESRPIQIFGRNSVSGTYGYFKEVALCSGDFKKEVNEQPGSASVVHSVGTSISAIGYSGIGYRTPNVRALSLARSATAPFVEATAENVIAGHYPLVRILYIYVNKEPNRELPLLEQEFLKLVLSREGQDIVRRDGYIPLSKPMIEFTRRRLDF